MTPAQASEAVFWLLVCASLLLLLFVRWWIK
jgi:hypothetical protein